MNKSAAAAFLGVSVRALERYTAQNRLAARYEPGRTSRVLVYDEDELSRFRDELARPTHRPALEPMEGRQTPPKPANSLASFGDLQLPPSSANPATPLASFGDLSHLAALLGQFANASPIPKAPPAAPPVADKLLLTLEEVALLTGLSRARLLEAIQSGALLARKIGRSWRVKRRDLDAFIDAF